MQIQVTPETDPTTGHLLSTTIVVSLTPQETAQRGALGQPSAGQRAHFFIEAFPSPDPTATGPMIGDSRTFQPGGDKDAQIGIVLGRQALEAIGATDPATTVTTVTSWVQQHLQPWLSLAGPM